MEPMGRDNSWVPRLQRETLKDDPKPAMPSEPCSDKLRSSFLQRWSWRPQLSWLPGRGTSTNLFEALARYSYGVDSSLRMNHPSPQPNRKTDHVMNASPRQGQALSLCQIRDSLEQAR